MTSFCAPTIAPFLQPSALLHLQRKMNLLLARQSCALPLQLNVAVRKISGRRGGCNAMGCPYTALKLVEAGTLWHFLSLLFIFILAMLFGSFVSPITEWIFHLIFHTATSVPSSGLMLLRGIIWKTCWCDKKCCCHQQTHSWLRRIFLILHLICYWLNCWWLARGGLLPCVLLCDNAASECQLQTCCSP